MRIIPALVLASALAAGTAHAEDKPASTAAPAPAAAPESSGKIEVGSPAPMISLTNQDGKTWSLADRKGKGWTVVFFYPKAGSPGCITQVCAYNDRTGPIRAQGAVIVGISADKQEDQKKFHETHKLGFDLLSDPDAKVIEAYGTKMAMVSMASRQTFIIDPQLVVRAVDNNVEPAFDADIVAHELAELQHPPKAGSEEDAD
jgi:peroxiredoxin Q/BCP